MRYIRLILTLMLSTTCTLFAMGGGGGTLTIDTASLSVAENSTGSAGTIAITNTTGDTPTFSLSGGVDDGFFTINSSTGVISINTGSFAAGKPDYEIPEDSGADNGYSIEVTVTTPCGGMQSCKTATRAITITVTDVAEAVTATGTVTITVTDVLEAPASVPCSSVKFNASNLAANKLATQIVNENFDVDISAVCNNPDEYLEDMSVRIELMDSDCGTSLSTLQTGVALTDANGFAATVANNSYNLSNKDLWIKITDESDPAVTSCSSDAFAIRPDRFAIEVRKSDGTLLDNILSTGVPIQAAGDDFNITVTALDANSNPVPWFNEAFTVSAALNGAGVLGTLENTAQTFLDGTKTFVSSYSEVGIIDINVTSDTTYAEVDNADGSDYVISGSGQTTGRFIPDHFDVTATVLDMTSPAKIVNPVDCNYTYLSQDLDYNVTVAFEVNVSALNANGGVTASYDAAAYAKNITLDMIFEYDVSGITHSANIADDIAGTAFSAGKISQAKSATFNVSAPNSRKSPQNPIIFNAGNITKFTAMDVNDSDGVNENVALPYAVNGASSLGMYLLYGRVNPIDATSVANGDVNVKIYYEVYGTDKNVVAKAFNTTSLNESVNDVSWWRNPRHETCDNFDADDFVLGTLPGGTVKGSVTPTGDHDDVVFSFSGTRPTKIKVDVDMNDKYNFLYHHPYSDNYISSFYIQFITGQTVGADSDIIKDEGIETKGSSRIGE